MTPRKAILAECCKCMNTPVFHGCISEICKLNDTTVSHIKRIKAHCLDCIPENSRRGVKNCDGRLMGGEICILHPYRLGKNPRRVAAGKKNGCSSEEMVKGRLRHAKER